MAERQLKIPSREIPSGVEFSPTELQTALAASAVWKVYRSRRGQRERLVADFLIGAHALCQTDRLLTRDRGFYRTYFARLPILDPTKGGRRL